MGYSEAPWTFKGRALYQLQLVRAEEARKYIPNDFKLVDFFGWTLGGVYLARYDDSPVGVFDECVVMAGLVWNPPTSCAWAGRVFVSDREARDHGLRSVGLPSRLASFQPVASAGTDARRARGLDPLSWWRKGREQLQQDKAVATAAAVAAAPAAGLKLPGGFMDVVEMRTAERGRRALAAPVATFKLPPLRTEGFLGPRMRLSLPSFSGGTAEHPSLLQYSCDLQTSIMPVTPIAIELHHSDLQQAAAPRQQQQQQQQEGKQEAQQRGWWWQGRREQRRSGGSGGGGGEVLDALLGGRPLLALAFSDMVMNVEEPLHLPSPAQAEPARAALPLATVPPRP